MINAMANGEDGIRQAVDSAPEFEPGPRIIAKPWPTWDKATMHGVAGEFVNCVAPQLEADPIGILIHLLTAFGNAAGSSVYIEGGGVPHHLNLFANVVGESSRSRKGTSWSPVRKSFSRIAPDWIENHVQGGLSSGEGLIWVVRDPILKREPIKEKGRFSGDYQEYESDAGVADKRLFVLEPEFVNVLHVASRERNTLSAVIRQAWDDGVLRVMTKNSPAKATGAHISVVGHITAEELLRSLDTVEAANGFGNRFLWLCVRRAQFLAFGGKFNDVELLPLEQRLRAALDFARRGGALSFSAAAARLWEKIYCDLSEGRPGLLGAILARAEAQTLRLASLYAVLDCSLQIEPDHLEAAVALWDYCKASAEFIFGAKLGDPDADAILTALRANPQGLTRTQITNNVFSRNLSVDRLDRALSRLLRHQLARVEERRTAGRTAEVWVLARPEDKQ